MKESDVRTRIDSFLRRAMLPAAMGIALSACSGEPSQPVSKYSAPGDGAADVSDPVAEYMAPMPDGGGAQPLYMAVMPDSGAQDNVPALKYMTVMPGSG